jgi:hypothetical protein
VHGWNAARFAVHAVTEESLEETPIPGVCCPGIPDLCQHWSHTYLDFDFTVRLNSREVQVDDAFRIGPSANFGCPNHLSPYIVGAPVEYTGYSNVRTKPLY